MSKKTIDTLAKKFDEGIVRTENTSLDLIGEFGDLAKDLRKIGKGSETNEDQARKSAENMANKTAKNYGLNSEDNGYWLKKGLGFDDTQITSTLVQKGLTTDTISAVVDSKEFQKGQQEFSDYRIEKSVKAEDLYKPEVFQELGLKEVESERAKNVLKAGDIANFAYLKEKGQDMELVQKTMLNNPLQKLALKDSYVKKATQKAKKS